VQLDHPGDAVAASGEDADWVNGSRHPLLIGWLDSDAADHTEA
jgi:hypothetical protein